MRDNEHYRTSHAQSCSIAHDLEEIDQPGLLCHDIVDQYQKKKKICPKNLTLGIWGVTHDGVVSSYSTPTSLPRFDESSTDPRVLGRHTYNYLQIY